MQENKPNNKKNGGFVTAKSLTPEQRKEKAKKAIAARWDKSIKTATHGSPDHPLLIGDIAIPCYVLNDGTRVLSQSGMQIGVGMSRGGGKTGAPRMVEFIEILEKKGLKTANLSVRLKNPIIFKNKFKTRIHGYEATIINDICDLVLEARKSGFIDKNSVIAQRCEVLVRGLSRVGIIALIDEATGYQKSRAADALSKILEAFIAKELQPYVKTFPPEFYENMFRLRGLPFPSESVGRPKYFGILTNDIIYKRLAPGVLEELKRITPRDDKGRYKNKFFQRLTQNEGYRKLVELIASVITIMRLSERWADFMEKINKLHQRYGDNLELPLDDTGEGI
jgi:hypothetical protein